MKITDLDPQMVIIRGKKYEKPRILSGSFSSWLESLIRSKTDGRLLENKNIVLVYSDGRKKRL